MDQLQRDLTMLKDDGAFSIDHETGQEMPVATYPLRTYNPSTDSGVVIGPWKDHIRSQAPFKYFDHEAMKRHELLLEGLVARCMPIMACGTEDDTQVKGWICGEHQGDIPVLHMLWVRNTWRQRGIGAALMRIYFAQEFGRHAIYHTHPGRSVKHLRSKWKLVHNPYLVMG